MKVRCSLGALCFLLVIWPTTPASAQPQSDIFSHHFFVPPQTPIPLETHRPPPSRQIPAGWFIGTGIVLGLGSVWLLIRSVRVWRAFNLFDRQYRFSQPQDVATRLGAERNGGHMAAIRFGEPPGT